MSAMVAGHATKAQKLPRKRIFNKSASIKSIKTQLVTPKAQHLQCQSYAEQDSVQANSKSVQFRARDTIFGDFCDDNVCACAVSTLILLSIANLSPEMDSATQISYET